MKLTFLLLTAAFLNVSANGLSQSVSFSGKNIPLKKVFSAIEKQTGYVIMYSSEVIANARPVSINVENIPLNEFLDKVLYGQNIKYAIEGKRSIFLSRKLAIVESPDRQSSSSNQRFDNLLNTIKNPIDVKGRVVNEKGEPVIASVQIKGTNKGTTTNDNGEFELKGVDDNAVLVISGVSIQTFEWSLNGKTELALTAKIKTVQGEEVQILSTGYQDIPRERATGSFVKIDKELLNRKISTNILDRLSGVTNGALFSRGENPIIIRGFSTINTNKRPLIVIDGFPYDESTDFQNIVNNINPGDIESITILKDAAAASIWGARAGNGVIVITTKRGKYNQKVIVQLNSNITVTNKPDLFNVSTISSQDEIAFETKRFSTGAFNRNDDTYPSINYFPVLPQIIEILLAKRNGSISSVEADEKIAILNEHDVKDDISKYLLQKSINQQQSLNVSGGTYNFNYYGSVGYDKNRSNNIGDTYDRLTLRFNNTFKIIKSLEVNSYINYVQSNSKNNSISVSSLPPYTRLADEANNSLAIPWKYRLAYVDTAVSSSLLDWHYRPLDEQKLNDNSSKQSDVRIGAGVKYNLFSGLNIEVKYQYQRILTNSRQYYSQESFLTRDLINQFTFFDGTGQLIRPVPLGGILDQSATQLTQWNFRTQLNYNKNWVQHGISALTGIETREAKSEFNSGRKYGYDDLSGTTQNQLDYKNIYALKPLSSSGSIPNPGFVGQTLFRYISYFGNASYSYQNKYTFSVSGRLDGSNLFGVKANQRIAPLWSSGLLWDLTEEQFYKIKWLSILKFRATYGYNGNTNNGNAYPIIVYNNPGSFSIIPVPYATVQNPPNPELRWEKSRHINFGLDFETKGNRISGSVEFYLKKGIDLIGPILVDYTTGWSDFTGNRANIKGKGVDLILNTKNVNRNIKWSSSFIFNYSSNKVTAYNKPGVLTSQYLGNTPILGKSLGRIYSYNWAGLDSLTGNPRAYVGGQITSFNNVISKAKPEDLIYNGPSIPVVFGSLINTLNLDRLSLSFLISYKLGYYFRRSSINYSTLFSSYIAHGDYSKRWQKPGDETFTNVPSLPASSNGNRDQVYNFSNILIEKGDHIRFQDIRLSYDILKPGSAKLPFQHLQLYLYASNLGIIIWRANSKGIDPDYENTPLPGKSYAVGVNIDL